MTSLERLKALNSLPDLPSQLQEARGLCNHSSRADMILRWLLAKLKASSDTRKTAQSWDLLSSCVRLLSPQRLASLLLPGGFVEVLQTTSAESEHDLETISAIARLWSLLHDLGHSRDGTAVLSLLSVKSTVAAALCGNWMQHLYATFKENSSNLATLFDQSLLHLGLQVWNIRRRDASDDKLFNTTCLVPACLLLVLVRERSEGPLSPKRKRSQVKPASNRNDTGSLEAMIARHMILPARAIFFKKSGGEGRRKKGLGVTVGQTDITEALGSLSQAVIRSPSVRTLESIPLVLDIALRSVATPTPRHRFTERPWIEAIFASLCDLVSNAEQKSINRVITSMLQSIKRHNASLTQQTLSKLVKQHAISSKAEQLFDWDMTSEVCRLDCNVFINRTVSEEVFSSMIAIQQQQPNNMEMQKCKDEILVPIMKAYAQNRSMRAFMELWRDQLLQETGTEPKSLWSEICPEFAEILESSQSSDDILAAFDHFASSVDHTGDAKPDLRNHHIPRKLRADFILLRGLLDGCRTEELTARIQGRLDTLRKNLFGLEDRIADLTEFNFHGELWRLLTSLFELWFPSWAVQQADNTQVAEMGLTLFKSSVFRVALSQCETMTTSTDLAQRFVGTLYSRFCRYGFHSQCSALCETALKALCKQPLTASLVFTKNPTLLEIMPQELARHTVKSIHEGASDSENETRSRRLGVLPTTAQQLILGDAIATATIQKKSKGATKTQVVLQDILSNVDTGVIEPQQRADALDILLHLPAPDWDEKGSKLLHQRLATILKLATQPCEGAKLLVDAAKLWDLLQLFQEPKSKKRGNEVHGIDIESATTLLSEVAKAVIRYWIARKRQGHGIDLLTATAERVKAEVETLVEESGKVNTGRLASLTLVGTAYSLLESPAVAGPAKPFAHQQTEIVHQLLDMLLTEAAALQFNIRVPANEQEPQFLLCVLDALLTLPNSTIDALGSKHAEITRKIERLARSSLADAQENDQSPTYSTRVLVKYYQLACRYATTDAPDLRLTERVLSHELSTPDHYAVLQAFEDQMKLATTGSRISIIESFVVEGSTMSLAVLHLYRRAIRALSKEDVEATTLFSAQDVLLRTTSLVCNASNIHVRKLALQIISLVLKEKPFMVNQYGVEQTISTMHRMMSTEANIEAVYLDACQLLTICLAQYRARLQGRYHLMVGLFQAFISGIFRETKSDAFKEGRVRHARVLARLLETFCSPPYVRHSSKNSELVDEARRAKAHAGQYVQYILHYYCSQVLVSTPADGVREALLPGLWALIEAIEANNSEGIKVLSAMMNNSERLILRSLYDDWKRFGKWEGL